MCRYADPAGADDQGSSLLSHPSRFAAPHPSTPLPIHSLRANAQIRLVLMIEDPCDPLSSFRSTPPTCQCSLLPTPPVPCRSGWTRVRRSGGRWASRTRATRGDEIAGAFFEVQGEGERGEVGRGDE
ncbi:unnamed protein product, partial [Closterium sp. Naga37s-1]